MEEGSGTRSSLLWEVGRLLKEGQNDQLPQILLMENVPEVQGIKNRYSFNMWKRTLEKLGYTNFVKQLDGKDFGIMQRRKRCFMLSVLYNDLYYYFPNKINSELRFEDFLEPIKDVNQNNILSERLLKHLLKENDFDRKGHFLDRIDKKRPYACTLCTRDGKTALDNFVLEDTTIDIKSLLKKENNEIQNILQGKVRRLSAKEAWRFMGFPDKDFRKVSKIISETRLYKQAGNSIMVTVLIAIFSKLYKDIDYEKIIKLYIDSEILGGHNETKK